MQANAIPIVCQVSGRSPSQATPKAIGIRIESRETAARLVAPFQLIAAIRKKKAMK